jgi:hypothetical protein
MKYVKMLGLAAVAAAALMAFAASASATTLEIGGVTQNKAVKIVATLSSGTSAILKDEFGTTTDTCTTSNVEGETSETKDANETITPKVFTGGTMVGGTVSKLTFENCTHETKVDANGKLWVDWTSGTNGDVYSSGAEVTVFSTFFGAIANCKTGASTKIGTLAGVKTGKAKMTISAKVPCGILGTATWTGEYTVTSPEGLGVES